MKLGKYMKGKLAQSEMPKLSGDEWIKETVGEERNPHQKTQNKTEKKELEWGKGNERQRERQGPPVALAELIRFVCTAHDIILLSVFGGWWWCCFQPETDSTAQIYNGETRVRSVSVPYGIF